QSSAGGSLLESNARLDCALVLSRVSFACPPRRRRKPPDLAAESLKENRPWRSTASSNRCSWTPAKPMCGPHSLFYCPAVQTGARRRLLQQGGRRGSDLVGSLGRMRRGRAPWTAGRPGPGICCGSACSLANPPLEVSELAFVPYAVSFAASLWKSLGAKNCQLKTPRLAADFIDALSRLAVPASESAQPLARPPVIAWPLLNHRLLCLEPLALDDMRLAEGAAEAAAAAPRSLSLELRATVSNCLRCLSLAGRYEEDLCYIGFSIAKLSTRDAPDAYFCLAVERVTHSELAGSVWATFMAAAEHLSMEDTAKDAMRSALERRQQMSTLSAVYWPNVSHYVPAMLSNRKRGWLDRRSAHFWRTMKFEHGSKPVFEFEIVGLCCTFSIDACAMLTTHQSASGFGRFTWSPVNHVDEVAVLSGVRVSLKHAMRELAKAYHPALSDIVDAVAGQSSAGGSLLESNARLDCALVLLRVFRVSAETATEASRSGGRESETHRENRALAQHCFIKSLQLDPRPSRMCGPHSACSTASLYKLEHGAACFNKAVDADPTSSAAWAGCAVAARLDGRADQTRDLLRQRAAVPASESAQPLAQTPRDRLALLNHRLLCLERLGLMKEAANTALDLFSLALDDMRLAEGAAEAAAAAHPPESSLELASHLVSNCLRCLSLAGRVRGGGEPMLTTCGTAWAAIFLLSCQPGDAPETRHEQLELGIQLLLLGRGTVTHSELAVPLWATFNGGGGAPEHGRHRQRRRPRLKRRCVGVGGRQQMSTGWLDSGSAHFGDDEIRARLEASFEFEIRWALLHFSIDACAAGPHQSASGFGRLLGRQYLDEMDASPWLPAAVPALGKRLRQRLANCVKPPWGFRKRFSGKKPEPLWISAAKEINQADGQAGGRSALRRPRHANAVIAALDNCEKQLGGCRKSRGSILPSLASGLSSTCEFITNPRSPTLSRNEEFCPAGSAGDLHRRSI
uniref:TPR_REGION domain-containing protein n=1 Tax=Macrostomum lignano TaxID=282301 RepID=A0A1I8JMS1_9PLAT